MRTSQSSWMFAKPSLPEIVREVYFLPGDRLDWLHPSHGPLPHLAVEVLYENHTFVVAVWDRTDGNCETAVDGPEVWDRWHNGILLTRLWFCWQGYARAGGIKVKLPQDSWGRWCTLAIAAVQDYTSEG